MARSIHPFSSGQVQESAPNHLLTENQPPSFPGPLHKGRPWRVLGARQCLDPVEHSTRGNVPNKICAEQRVAEALLETLGSWLQIQPRFFLKARQTEGDFSGHFAVPSLLWVGVGTLKGKRKKKPGTQCERRSLAGVLVPGLVERNLNPRRIRPGSPALVAESQLRAAGSWAPGWGIRASEKTGPSQPRVTLGSRCSRVTPACRQRLK